jgi:hypothetical protein
MRPGPDAAEGGRSRWRDRRTGEAEAANAFPTPFPRFSEKLWKGETEAAHVDSWHLSMCTCTSESESANPVLLFDREAIEPLSQ